MGRPTDYGPQIVELAKAYLEQFEDSEYTKEVVPTIEGLALFLGTHRDTVYAWGKDHSEFSDIVELVRTTKSHALQNGALSNKLNASVAKLLLGHEGYREAQDVTTNGKDMPQPILASVKEDE